MKSPSLVRPVDILKALGDNKSLQVFCAVATGVVDSQTLKTGKGLSRKQYYSRTNRMTKAGLIKRKKNRFSLTTLGIIVYHAQMEIDSAVKNYWKLKAIDSIKASHEMNKEERAKLIKTIISDETIEKILDK